VNKIIEAGDTVGAAVKVGAAVVVVYGLYKAYQFSQDVKSKVDSIEQGVNDAKAAGTEFVTETINPTSRENFINQAVGDYTKPVFFKVFDFFGVGK